MVVKGVPDLLVKQWGGGGWRYFEYLALSLLNPLEDGEDSTAAVPGSFCAPFPSWGAGS